MRRKSFLSVIFVSCYAIFFAIYLFFGLQPAGAESYEISAELSIPSIGLTSDVTTLKLSNRELNTPDYIVGSFNKYPSTTLLIGHSATIFQNLPTIQIGDHIIYDETDYLVTKLETLEKAAIDMDALLEKSSTPKLILMTCTGIDLGNGDSTHRLIVTATT